MNNPNLLDFIGYDRSNSHTIDPILIRVRHENFKILNILCTCNYIYLWNIIERIKVTSPFVLIVAH